MSRGHLIFVLFCAASWVSMMISAEFKETTIKNAKNTPCAYHMDGDTLIIDSSNCYLDIDLARKEMRLRG